jgi:hypothetical protein
MRRSIILLGVLFWIAGDQAAAQAPNRQDSSGQGSHSQPGTRNGGTMHSHRVAFFPGPFILWPDYVYYGQPIFLPTPYPYPFIVPPIWNMQPPARPMPPAGQNPPANPPPANNPPPAKQPPPAPPPDDLQTRAEMQRFIRIGNDYFAEGKFAQALSQYDRALAAAPLEPLSYFHQAQADLALGKYGQAVVAIQRGLRLHPHWATADFQPRALYRDRAGEYQSHLGTLAELTAKNPNDESLLFLLGYQLWFDGKHDEAVVLFRKAATLAVDPTLINRFLQADKPAAGQ